MYFYYSYKNVIYFISTRITTASFINSKIEENIISFLISFLSAILQLIH